MLPRQCITSDLSIPACLDVAQSGEFVNIKFSYQRQMGVYGRGLSQMLAGLGLQFDGRLHSGIDDCLNMVKILEGLARQGAVFENNGRPEPSASAPRRCYNCNQPGHLSNECSAPRSARSGRGTGAGAGAGEHFNTINEIRIRKGLFQIIYYELVDKYSRKKLTGNKSGHDHLSSQHGYCCCRCSSEDQNDQQSKRARKRQG